MSVQPSAPMRAFAKAPTGAFPAGVFIGPRAGSYAQSPSRLGLLGLLTLCLALASCRDSKGGSGGSNTGFALSSVGGSGCVGAQQAFSGICAPCVESVPLSTLMIGQSSQIISVQGQDRLIATGLTGQVVDVDLSGAAPLETEILSAGDLDLLLAAIPGSNPTELSGLALLGADRLVLADLANNCLWSVDPTDLVPATTLELLAGQPDLAAGNNSTAVPAPLARFNFSAPMTLVATGGPTPELLIADPGNHAIRRWQSDDPTGMTPGFVSTLAGTGSPFFLDGSTQAAGLDTPVGLTVTCSGTLLVAELGSAGSPMLGSGPRLRQLILGPTSFFGTSGTLATFVGDGMDQTTAGQGELASVAGPQTLISTAEEDIYWVDSTTGVLRRVTGTDRDADCPLFADCASAVGAGGTFSPGGHQSITQTSSGRLFVLDFGASGSLLELTP